MNIVPRKSSPPASVNSLGIFPFPMLPNRDFFVGDGGRIAVKGTDVATNVPTVRAKHICTRATLSLTCLVASVNRVTSGTVLKPAEFAARVDMHSATRTRTSGALSATYLERTFAI